MRRDDFPLYGFLNFEKENAPEAPVTVASALPSGCPLMSILSSSQSAVKKGKAPSRYPCLQDFHQSNDLSVCDAS
ncbi:MAG: hypothetical protein VYC67_01030 [Pseudomonadota bacterium]|nr:hypothetical protein [Pseudomonadota bacterium]